MKPPATKSRRGFASAGEPPSMGRATSAQRGPDPFHSGGYEPFTAIDILRELFDVDFETGMLRRRKTGKAVGSIGRTGYASVRVAGQKLRAHRVIWALAYGSWPDGPLDHINGKRADNRLSNLRLGSGGINQRNTARSNRSSTGRTGVSWDKRKRIWRAYINRSGHREHLGYFARFEDAAAARARAEASLGYSPRHGAGRVTHHHVFNRQYPQGMMAYLEAYLIKQEQLED